MKYGIDTNVLPVTMKWLETYVTQTLILLNYNKCIIKSY